MVKIEAVLHPEEAELVWSMLDHAAKHLADSAELGELAAAQALLLRSRTSRRTDARIPRNRAGPPPRV